MGSLREVMRGGLATPLAMIVLLLAAAPRMAALRASVGILVPLHSRGGEPWLDMRPVAAAAILAVRHINQRNSTLVPDMEALLPPDFVLEYDLQSSMLDPAIGVASALQWQQEGRHVLVGSFESAVTATLALTASIDGTPVVSWASSSPALSAKDQYPTLSRLVPSDWAYAAEVIRSIASFGWRNLGIIYIDDIWARDFALACAEHGASLGMGTSSSAFTSSGGSGKSISSAVASMQHAQERVILCLVQEADFAPLLRAAADRRMLGRGHAWLLVDSAAVVSPARNKLLADLTPLLVGTFWLRRDFEHQPRMESPPVRIEHVLAAEPVSHLGHGLLPDLTSGELASTSAGRCDACALIYDAVVVAAAGVAQAAASEPAAEGREAKEELLRRLRGVRFDGASGQLTLDAATGDRDAAMGVVWANVQADWEDTEPGASDVEWVDTWRWDAGTGAMVRVSEGSPVWPGGAEGWQLGVVEEECGEGEAMSASTLRCEACAQGTAKEGGHCVRVDASVGVLVPLHSEAQPRPQHLSIVAAAAMAVHHINTRDSSLVPDAVLLLPAGFKLDVDIQDSFAQPVAAVKRAVEWVEQGRDVVIGSWLSAVTGPLALVASLSNTPVISWGSTASTLSDRATYPTLSRTIAQDALLAASLVRFIDAMGSQWTSPTVPVAILYVDDAWGRAFAQDATAAAAAQDVAVVAIKYARGEAQGLEAMLNSAAEAGARVMICAVLAVEIPRIAVAALRRRLLRPGYVWMSVSGEFPSQVDVAGTAEAEEVAEALTGWFTAAINPLHGQRGARFREVLSQERGESLKAGKRLAEELGVGLEEAVAAYACTAFCATIYDAVWAAAIAVGRVRGAAGEVEDGANRARRGGERGWGRGRGREESGAEGGLGLGDGNWAHRALFSTESEESAHKEALLAAVRNVSFHGASGWVELDSKGDRLSADSPLTVKNLRAFADAWGGGEDGGGSEDGGGRVVVREEAAWLWQAGVLEQEGVRPPVWPGGAEGWQLGVAEEECGEGEAMSASTLRCEACAQGTAKEGGHCVRVDASVGVLVPLWSTDAVPQMLGDSFVTVAAAAMLAVLHINRRDSSVVPDARQLLPDGFRMVMELRDSNGLSAAAARATLAMTGAGRDAIVGSFRSSVSESVARVAALEGVPVVSWGSEIPQLSDKAEYPTFSRTIPPLTFQVRAMMEALLALGIRRVAFLFGDARFGSGSVQEAMRVAAERGMQIAASVEYVEDDEMQVEEAVARIHRSAARIIVWIPTGFEPWKVVQRADELGLFNPGFVWVVTSRLLDPNYASAGMQGTTAAEVQRLMSGWISVQGDFPVQSDLLRLQAAMQAEPLSRLNHSLISPVLGPQHVAAVRNAAFMYDAVWAAALGSANAGRAPGGAVDKTQLLHSIRAARFTGASGDVRLDPHTGDRILLGVDALIFNLQPDPAAGPTALQPVAVWRLHSNATLGREVSDEQPPWWPGGTRSWQAPQDGSCAAGFVFDGAQSRCAPCPPGTFGVAQASECEACEAGTFAAEAGSLRCSHCQAGFANTSGLAACFACPAHAARRPASLGLSAAECLCDAGYYRPARDPSTPCEPCPVGAECPGGAEPPHPQAGYWGDRTCHEFGKGNTSCGQWDLFVRCSPEEACVGGPEFACAAGLDGRLCRSTRAGWFIVGDDVFECGPAGAVVAVVCIALVLLCWVGIELLVGHAYPVVQVLLTNIQVLAIIASFDLRWTRTLRHLQTALSIVDFDVDFVSPSCLGTWSETSSHLLQLLLPFLFTAVCGLFHAGRAVLRREALDAADVGRSMAAHFVLITMTVFHTLTIRCFQAFSCTPFPDETRYMTHLISVECWSNSHMLIVALSSLYIAFVLVLTPAYSFLSLRWHIRNHSLHSPLAVRMWGWMHSSYEAEWKLWEAVMLFRRFAVALISVLGTPLIKAALTIVTLTAMLAAHVWARPFINARVDQLDFCSICGTILFTLLGMLLYPNITEQGQRWGCTEGDWGEKCRSESTVKAVVAGLALALALLTIVVSLTLAFFVFLETHTCKQASRLIYLGFKKSDEARRASASTEGSSSEPLHAVPAETVLRGSRLMVWARFVVSGARAQSSRESFLRVDRGLRAMEEDVTQCSTSPRARVLRRLCSIDGLLEALGWQGGELREAVALLVEALIEQEAAGRGEVDPYPVSDSVKFEHRPVLAQWLLCCSAGDRVHFQELLESLLMANQLHAAQATLVRTQSAASPSVQSTSRNSRNSLLNDPTRDSPLRVAAWLSLSPRSGTGLADSRSSSLSFPRGNALRSSSLSFPRGNALRSSPLSFPRGNALRPPPLRCGGAGQQGSMEPSEVELVSASKVKLEESIWAGWTDLQDDTRRKRGRGEGGASAPVTSSGMARSSRLGPQTGSGVEMRSRSLRSGMSPDLRSALLDAHLRLAPPPTAVAVLRRSPLPADPEPQPLPHPQPQLVRLPSEELRNPREDPGETSPSECGDGPVTVDASPAVQVQVADPEELLVGIA